MAIENMRRVHIVVGGRHMRIGTPVTILPLVLNPYTEKLLSKYAFKQY